VARPAAAPRPPRAAAARPRPLPRPLEAAITPAWTFRLPRGGRGDGVIRVRRGVLTRLLAVGGHAVVVHAWQPGRDRVLLRAVPASAPVPTEALERAIERLRFALAVDDDLSEFARRFRGDPLIGAVIHHRPWHRPRRRPVAWEALAWAVTEQLIEVARAKRIQRRIVARWGSRLEQGTSLAWGGRGALRDVPTPAVIAGRAPAELAAMDLAPSRALALIRVAREVAAGRVDPACPAGDRRLLRIPGIGPWTVQVLGLAGRGEPDSLPAGDLAYVKLVGMLAGLGRRATVEEVEEFFAPYAPFRGLAGSFALARWHGAVAAGPPPRLAA
jgi:3-methyladenine DNA glycosylase/8-oxoguanine DNA glycosylase